MEAHEYILVPEWRPGHGTGHIRRSVRLARALGNAVIWLPHEQVASWATSIPGLDDFVISTDPEQLCGTVLLDKAVLEPEEARAWRRVGHLIGIDTRGKASTQCSYLIDTLPRLSRDPAQAPNISDRGFLNLPPRLRDPSRSVQSILVSFGGEDRKQQTLALYKSGFLQTNFPQARVTWVRASRMTDIDLPGWTKVDSPEGLNHLYPEHDLFLGLFGLSAYEALHAGCLVMLWNPSAYHQSLSVREGFISLGAGKRPRLEHGRDQTVAMAYTQARANHIVLKSLPDAIRALDLQSPFVCAACGSSATTVIQRFETRTYHECTACGMTSMALFAPQTQDYGEAYFFEAYQAQYGKTYLEDFDHIKAMGKRRLHDIHRYHPGRGRLLDIGCAYGPFLSAAKDEGWQAEGLDISSHAVEHCSKVLGIPARVVDIVQASPEEIHGGTPYDAVTLWYVIEHFPDLGGLLKTLNKLLLPGGLLALATPSMDGISARRSRRSFLEQSPVDHYSIWHPRKIRRTLAMFGFELVGTRGAGHHPERFAGIWGSKCMRPLTSLISKFGGMADTFELCARKVRELE